MSNLIGDITKEIIGAFVLGIMAIVFIFIFATLGETTGQTVFTNQMIQTMMIVVFGVGLPIGVIALIKFLMEMTNGNTSYY